MSNFKSFLENITFTFREAPRPKMKTFDDFICRLFEREGDREQLDVANDIYDKVLYNIKDAIFTTDYEYSTYNLKPILEYDFWVVFRNKEGTGSNTSDDETKTPTLIIGQETYKFKNDGKDLFNFWHKNKNTIIHELIHISDHKRLSTKKNSNPDDLKKYYNNPLEFNAFYFEVADYFYNNKKKVSDNRNEFIKDAWEYVYQIQSDLKNNLSDTMLKKWNKRFYQLWDEIKNAKM